MMAPPTKALAFQHQNAFCFTMSSYRRRRFIMRMPVEPRALLQKRMLVLPERARRESSPPDLFLAAVLFGLGVSILLKAHSAEVHHTIVRSRHGAVMDPWQGYLAAFLCFGAAAHVIFKVVFSNPNV